MLQTDRQRKNVGGRKMLQIDRNRKTQGVQMFVCWTYFHSLKYGHRKVEEGKREEQSRVVLDSLVP